MAESVAKPQQRSGARLVELDILRDFLLLWMTLTHLPTKASVISNQTFGFVSGAEGFIFLAGFMVGQLEHRIEQRHGRRASVHDTLRRLVRVYVYHGALLAIAFTGVASFAVHFHRLALQNLLSFYLAHPKQAIVSAVALQYRPSLFDILPMYVIFLAVTPIARRIARSWGWDPVVYTSFALWAVAQFGLRTWLYDHAPWLWLGVPRDSIGAFDMYAWQLLWIVGLALGSIYSDQLAGLAPADVRERRGFPRWVIMLSTSAAAVFLVLRYSPVDHWMNPDSYGWLIDKWHLGPARVINFAALTIFLVRYGQHIAARPIFQPLALLGRASIEVFSVHVLCCLLGDALSPEADPNLSWIKQTLLLIFTVTALFLTAVLHKKWSSYRKSRVPAH